MGYTHIFADLAKQIETIAIIGGYPFLFLTVVLEGVPLIGTLVPGHVSLIVAGFLIKVGVFNVWITLILGISGALLGDYLGYYLGKKYGLSLIDKLKPYFFITNKHIKKAQDLLANHTGKAMVIGRLSPMTRALMPFLVGTNKTSDKQFWKFNIIGGCIWAISSIVLGFAFGAGYQAAAGFMGKFILIAICAAVVIIWGYRFVNIRFHVFKKYELFMLILNLLALWVLAQVVQDAWSIQPAVAGSSFVGSSLASFDVSVNLFMASHVTPYMASIANVITNCGGTLVIGGLSVIVTVALSLRKKWRSAAIMLLSIGSSAFVIGLLKEFFMRARPENALQVVTDPSFPSGHAGMAAAFFLIVAYLAMPKIRSWVWRELTFVACVLAIILIGLSRLVLNVHWASDVIAGWALGIFCATASVLLVRYVGELFHRKVLE